MGARESGKQNQKVSLLERLSAGEIRGVNARRIVQLCEGKGNEVDCRRSAVLFQQQMVFLDRHHLQLLRLQSLNGF